MIINTPYFSKCIGDLPEGCKMCVKGRKTVLFITGICSKHCFYCPISDQKWQKDVIYANEWKIKSFDDLVKEIELCSSTGVGITGGDPLTRVDRTAEYIVKLKERFGKKFHIHLYTPLNLVDETKLKKLNDAGLDEIRFNPDLELDKRETWKRIKLARKFDWTIGVEIPVIPGRLRETEKLIDFISDKVDFMNLNELEISDTNCNELTKMGFMPKDQISYAVKGSEQMAIQLLKYINAKKGIKMRAHFCTAKLKDRVQLQNRLKLRAKNYSTAYDTITEDGTIIRKVAYLKELTPGFGYIKQLESIPQQKRDEMLKKLKSMNDKIGGIIDSERVRIIISDKLVKKCKQQSELVVAEVEEYPTQDAMLVSLEYL